MKIISTQARRQQSLQDKAISQKLAGLEETPPARVWAGIEARLPQPSWRRGIFFPFLAPTAAVVAGLALWFGNIQVPEQAGFAEDIAAKRGNIAYNVGEEADGGAGNFNSGKSALAGANLADADIDARFNADEANLFAGPGMQTAPGKLDNRLFSYDAKLKSRLPKQHLSATGAGGNERLSAEDMAHADYALQSNMAGGRKADANTDMGRAAREYESINSGAGLVHKGEIKLKKQKTPISVVQTEDLKRIQAQERTGKFWQFSVSFQTGEVDAGLMKNGENVKDPASVLALSPRRFATTSGFSALSLHARYYLKPRAFVQMGLSHYNYTIYRKFSNSSASESVSPTLPNSPLFSHANPVVAQNMRRAYSAWYSNLMAQNLKSEINAVEFPLSVGYEPAIGRFSFPITAGAGVLMVYSSTNYLNVAQDNPDLSNAHLANIGNAGNDAFRAVNLTAHGEACAQYALRHGISFKLGCGYRQFLNTVNADTKYKMQPKALYATSGLQLKF